MSNLNPNYAQQLSKEQSPAQQNIGTSYLIARVVHVVQGPLLLGTNIPDVYYNDPTDLGKITFQLINGVQDRTLDSAGNNTAKPAYSAIKQYPLEGELVCIVPGPSIDMNESRGRRDFFYTLPYNLWNTSHQNAFPDLGDYSEYVSSVNLNYEETSDLNRTVNSNVTGALNMPLGPNFPEKDNIKGLRQFTGDVTLEGRWGNSIRFGSTSAVTVDQNNWSSTGSAGDPIVIIRNGQGTQENNIAWIPTVENINRDPSSIYLTAGQRIDIDDINRNFSLASLDTQLQATVTVSIPIQQQLTSIDSISAVEQDRKINPTDQNV